MQQGAKVSAKHPRYFVASVLFPGLLLAAPVALLYATVGDLDQGAQVGAAVIGIVVASFLIYLMVLCPSFWWLLTLFDRANHRTFVLSLACATLLGAFLAAVFVGGRYPEQYLLSFLLFSLATFAAILSAKLWAYWAFFPHNISVKRDASPQGGSRPSP